MSAFLSFLTIFDEVQRIWKKGCPGGKKMVS